MKSKIQEHQNSTLINMCKYSFIVAIVLSAIALTACNSNSNSINQKERADSVTTKTSGNKDTIMAMNNAPMKGVVTAYLQIKNGLVNDNGNDAASGGKAMMAAINNLNISLFTDVQKKTYNDMQDDLKENAEHIGGNGGKIAHQREHFDMLSQDMYDLVKTFNAGEHLYKDYCPTYNDKKGAFWISETKEIKNPYLGKEMPTCGEMKEEIKQ